MADNKNANTGKPEEKKQKIVTAETVSTMAIESIVGEDERHGWGIEDSLTAVKVLVAWRFGVKEAQLDEAFLAQVKRFINPSQFRQSIEGTAEEIQAGKAYLLKGATKKLTTTSIDEILKGLGNE